MNFQIQNEFIGDKETQNYFHFYLSFHKFLFDLKEMKINLIPNKIHLFKI